MDAIKELKEYDGYIQSEQYKIRHRVIQEIKQLRLANSDLQMHYDYAKDECDKLREVLKELEWQLKNQLYDAAYETVIHTLWPQLKEKE
jgi:predicted nuclease with TOPRIM domain